MVGLFNLDVELVKFYKYRRAKVAPIISFKADDEVLFELREFLESNGQSLDNHICMVVKAGNTELNLMYTDRQIWIGTLIEGYW